jgi:hypothetical protein
MATNPGPNPLLALTPSQIVSSQYSQWKDSIKQAGVDTRVAVPAFLAVDMDTADTQTVTVQIAVQERVRTPTGPQWWDVPPIIKVPVILPRGGGFAMTLPLKQNDEGLLIFCDSCFDLWWQNGQNGAPAAQNASKVASAPGSQQQLEIRRHDVHDCGFLPGMCSQPNILTNYSSDTAQWRTEDGDTYVELTSDEVNLVAASAVNITAAAVKAANGGTALPLVNDTFYQWYITNIQPFLDGLGYAGPPVPAGSETSVFTAE